MLATLPKAAVFSGPQVPPWCDGGLSADGGPGLPCPSCDWAVAGSLEQGSQVQESKRVPSGCVEVK